MMQQRIWIVQDLKTHHPIKAFTDKQKAESFERSLDIDAIVYATVLNESSEASGIQYYPIKTWMGYEVVRESADGCKEYLMSVRKGVYKWAIDYTYAAKYSKATALKHIKEVQS